MKINKYLILIIGIVLAGGLGFYGGTMYQKSVTPQNNFGGANNGVGRNRAIGVGGNQGRFGAQGFRPITGQVISQDSKSITVKLNDGTSRIVLLSTTTAYNKAVQASVSDVKVGDTVRVMGTANSDGSITAQDIQLNPILGQFGGSSAPAGN
jgi:ribosomal protein S17